MTSCGKIGIDLHHVPPGLSLRANSFEIYTCHARVPRPPAKCAWCKRRDELDLPCCGVFTKDGKLFCRLADQRRQALRPVGADIAVSREHERQSGNQTRHGNEQIQRQPVAGLRGIKAQLLRQDEKRQRAGERKHRKCPGLGLQDDKADDQARRTCKHHAKQAAS